MSFQSIIFNYLVAKLKGGLKKTIDLIEALQYGKVHMYMQRIIHSKRRINAHKKIKITRSFCINS